MFPGSLPTPAPQNCWLTPLLLWRSWTTAQLLLGKLPFCPHPGPHAEGFNGMQSPQPWVFCCYFEPLLQYLPFGTLEFFNLDVCLYLHHNNVFIDYGLNPHLLCILHWQVGSLHRHHLGSPLRLEGSHIFIYVGLSIWIAFQLFLKGNWNIKKLLANIDSWWNLWTESWGSDLLHCSPSSLGRSSTMISTKDHKLQTQICDWPGKRVGHDLATLKKQQIYNLIY